MRSTPSKGATAHERGRQYVSILGFERIQIY